MFLNLIDYRYITPNEQIHRFRNAKLFFLYLNRMKLMSHQFLFVRFNFVVFFFLVHINQINKTQNVDARLSYLI